MKKDKRIIFRLNSATYNKIIKCCCIYNCTISELMRDSLDYYFKDGSYEKQDFK